MIVLQLLQSMKIKFRFPIIVCVDNVGAILMTKNITSTVHSKHMDIFMIEYIEDGNIIFVKSSQQITTVTS